MCNIHYQRWYRHGDPLAGGPRLMPPPADGLCIMDGCSAPAKSRGFCNTHYHRWYMGYPMDAPIVRLAGRTEEQRFLDFVDETSSPSGCWLWTGAVNPEGYGLFGLTKSKEDRGGSISAHRWSYRHFVGPIPEWADCLDHTCHSFDLSCPGGAGDIHRRCVFFEHLEPATFKTNAQRGRNAGAWPFCPRGHEMDEDNTRIDPKSGKRSCRKCARLRYLERKARLQALGLPY